MSEPKLTSLDSADYDPIDDLNAIFSHPSTLTAVGATSQALRQYQDVLDEDISTLVAAQSASDAASVRRIQAAKAELAELFARIEGVRGRAARTERAITDMTADIKRLDSTKRNLTVSMTALKRLQMLTTAYEQLRGLGRTRQYRDCALLLQAVIQLAAHFRSYRSIDQIATLSRNVADLQRELLEQVCEDFEIIFAKGEVSQRRGMLAEACLVMDALGDHARQRLTNWYCNTQLREYRQVFRGSDEAGSLDNISRRYSWFNRMLKTYDTEHAFIFPAHWRVNEMLANSFCEGTREDYKSILLRSSRRSDSQSLDVNLLLSCLQETLNFEHSLEKRFANDPRTSTDTTLSQEDKPQGFTQAISEAFEPYMSLWVESQDRHLSSLIPSYRQQPLKSPDDEFNAQLVIPSSTDLFHFYRLTLGQCAKLSTGSRLLELSRTFAKYLDQYGQQVLFYFLGERSGPQGPSTEDTVLILNTADYCYQTCNQLEEKIRARIDAEFKAGVDLQSQADAFMGIASAAVRALVRAVETACEPAWREMRGTPWSALEAVADQSTYVAELARCVRARAAAALPLLQGKPAYARAFCDHVVDAMATAYLANVAQCKPVSEAGAEQMLLDSYVLKKAFTELPVLNAEPGTPPPAAYVKRVNQTMSRIDPLLKTLQVRPSPPEALVQAYLIHVGDRSDANFRKVLELKGIARRADVASLLDLFAAHRQAPSNDHLPQNSPLLTPLTISAGGSGGGGGGGAGGVVSGAVGGVGAGVGAALGASTPSLGGTRFDPASFGSALIGRAREGVAQASGAATPVLGQGQEGGGGGGAASSAGNLNENLRSIGKFFRRDVGGFGFGRGGEEAKG